MRGIRYIPVILAGFVIGVLLYVGYWCTSAWYHGGSADPRCAYGWEGYVEVHKLGTTVGQDHVSCEYRPEHGAP